MATQIQLRRGTASEWTSANPTLMQGEVGIELDTHKFKFGDGTTAWNSLSYSSGGSGTSGVNGSSGTSGVNGTSGTSGINGSNGSSGTSGANGQNGTSGTSGINGSNGSSGTSGANGQNGSSGTSGINGSNGSSGTSGANGQNGSSGTSGVDGSSGTSGTSGTSGETPTSMSYSNITDITNESQFAGTSSYALTASYALSGGSGGGSNNTGGPADPIKLENVKWFMVGTNGPTRGINGVLPAYSYYAGPDGGNPGVGAYIQSADNVNINDWVYDITLAMEIPLGKIAGVIGDGGQIVTAGDRVLLVDQSEYDSHQGIYVVNDTGSADASVPFVLTRATDFDDISEFKKDYVVNMTSGSFYAKTSRYSVADNYDYYGWAIMSDGGLATGYSSMAVGDKSVSIGSYSAAAGHSSMAIGWGAYATNGMIVIASNNPESAYTKDTPGIGNGGVAVIQGIDTTQTTDFTLSRVQMGRFIQCTGNINVTLPAQADVAIPFGANIQLCAVDGTVTLVTGSGVTLNGQTQTSAAGQILNIVKTDTDTWFAYASYATSSYAQKEYVNNTSYDTSSYTASIDLKYATLFDIGTIEDSTTAYIDLQNIEAGRKATILINGPTGAGTTGSISLPTEWIYVGGDRPTTVPSDKYSVLNITCFGDTATKVVCSLQ